MALPRPQRPRCRLHSDYPLVHDVSVQRGSNRSQAQAEGRRRVDTAAFCNTAMEIPQIDKQKQRRQPVSQSTDVF